MQLAEPPRVAYVLPVIHGERCVHSILPAASCQACVDSCPRSAWALDDELLLINTELCDGCGLCAAACPQGAILHRHEAVTIEWNGRHVALAACERSGAGRGTAVLPCLHALGVCDLLRLADSGVTCLVIARADCSNCSRGGGETLQQRLVSVNSMLEERGLPTVRLLEHDAVRWKRLSAVCTASGGPSTGRRAFLGRVLGVGLRQGLRLAGLHAVEDDAFTPPGALFPRGRSTGIVPFAPFINSQRCSGCDACIRLCPHAAITLDESTTLPAYRILADKCSGCGVCCDVCESDAAGFLSWQPVPAELIPLRVGACEACGVRFHRPRSDPANDTLCPVCSRTQGLRNPDRVFEIQA
jgi:Pyruvate/2-oxoacid:ferredoxin oxidoreductase delta subunit